MLISFISSTVPAPHGTCTSTVLKSSCHQPKCDQIKYCEVWSQWSPVKGQDISRSSSSPRGFGGLISWDHTPSPSAFSWETADNTSSTAPFPDVNSFSRSDSLPGISFERRYSSSLASSCRSFMRLLWRDSRSKTWQKKRQPWYNDNWYFIRLICHNSRSNIREMQGDLSEQEVQHLRK